MIIHKDINLNKKQKKRIRVAARPLLPRSFGANPSFASPLPLPLLCLCLYGTRPKGRVALRGTRPKGRVWHSKKGDCKSLKRGQFYLYLLKKRGQLGLNSRPTVYLICTTCSQ